MFFFTGPDPSPTTAESPSLQPNAQSGLDQSLTDHSAVDKKHIYRKFSSKNLQKSNTFTAWKILSVDL